MSRSMVLVSLLVILIITSQFEWNQPIPDEINESTAPDTSHNQQQQQHSIREEAIKEKIILSQEKNIRRLSELVDNLKEQIKECRGSNSTDKGTVKQLTELLSNQEKQQILEG
ncbi:hypothetical protein ACHQM5_021045 [Ranunculus cassubicifolius]